MRKWLLILGYAFRKARVLMWAFPLAIIAAGISVLQPWPMKVLVDNVLGTSPVPPVLERLLGALSMESTPAALLKVVALSGLVLFVSNRLVGALLAWVSIKGSWGTVHSLAGDVFARLQRRSLAFHKKNAVGELMSRVLGDCRCAQETLENLLFAPAVALGTIIGMLVLMLNISVTLTLLAFASFPISWAISASASSRLRTAARANREIEGQIQSHVQQTFAGIGVVQAFAQEAHQETRFRNLTEQLIRTQKTNLLLGRVNHLGTGSITVLISGLILWLIARDVLAGSVSLGSALVFLAYFGSLQGQLTVLRGLSTNIHLVGENARRVAQVLDTPPEIVEQPNAAVLPRIRGEVEFRNVSAGYGDREVLKNVSFRVKPGQTVALIGPTGSGKTTLVSLIPRFEDPSAGSVLIDGHDIRDVNLQSLRSQIALVLQDPFLSAVSVAENIACGCAEATPAQIEAAARAAHAHEFIAALPQGYDTVIGERGATLSGGMRQRISIARALLKDAPILILDEPSSALDAETEKLIFEALRDYTTNRTTLIIAHRLSTIRNADLIMVLKDGEIVESGRQAELLERPGYYAQLQGAV